MGAALFIHGFASDRNDFARLVPLLSARYEHVFAPNLPGHAPHHRTPMNCCKIFEFITDAFDRLKAKYKYVDVYGFSMGGAIASYIASIRDVNRLILLAPANKYLSLTSHLAMIERAVQTNPSMFNGSQRNLCSPRQIREDSKIARTMFFKQLLPYYTPKNLLEFNKVVRRCNKYLRPINIPTLILWGRFDQFVPHSSVRHLLSYCRNRHTYVSVYSDISHIMLHSCVYYELIDDIHLFLEKTDARMLC